MHGFIASDATQDATCMKTENGTYNMKRTEVFAKWKSK